MRPLLLAKKNILLACAPLIKLKDIAPINVIERAAPETIKNCALESPAASKVKVPLGTIFPPEVYLTPGLKVAVPPL